MEQAVPDMLAAQAKISRSDLVLAETSTIKIPFVDKEYWYAWIVNLSGEQQPVFEVEVDVDKRIFAGGDGIDPQYYWQEAEKIFSKTYRSAILQTAALRYGIPIENLQIVNSILYYYSFTGTIVWKGKLTASDKPQIFEITTDLTGAWVDPDVLQKRGDEEKQKKFGKLDRILYYYLQAVPDDRQVPLMVWVKDIDYDQISQMLVQAFPAIRASRFANGIPVDSNGVPLPIDKKTADAVDKEYRKLIKAAQGENKKDILADLKKAGFSPTDLNSFPGFNITLSKKDVTALSEKYNDKISVLSLNIIVEPTP